MTTPNPMDEAPAQAPHGPVGPPPEGTTEPLYACARHVIPNPTCTDCATASRNLRAATLAFDPEPSPPVPAAEGDAVGRAIEACRRVERRRALIADVDLPGEYARAALDAAGVSALSDANAALRVKVAQLDAEVDEYAPAVAALTARAEAAEAEVERLRERHDVHVADLTCQRDEARQQVARVEALAARAESRGVCHVPRDDDGQVDVQPAVAVPDIRAALAGSGEQPGEDWPTRANRASLDAANEHEPNGRCQADNCPGPHPGERRPAPVVPDSPGLRERAAKEARRAWQETAATGDDDVVWRAVVSAVLAAVGQGVTAEQVEIAAQAAFMSDDLGGHHKPGPFILSPHTWENIPEVGRENYRRLVRDILASLGIAVVRSGEQGGEA